MKLSVQSSNILNKNLDNAKEALQLIKDCGFTALDLHFPQYDREDIRAGKTSPFFDKSVDILLRQYEELGKLAKDMGIEIGQAHAPYPSYVFCEDKAFNDYLLSTIKKTIKIASSLGAKYIVVHPIFSSDLTKKLDIKTENEKNMEFYSSFINILKECNITMCIENMYAKYKGKIYGDFCSDPYEAVCIIDALNAKAGKELFGFCFDSGHTTLAGRDPYRFIKILGNRIKVLHLHDNYGIVDQHFGAFMGVANWERICTGLKEIGYTGNINFETYKLLDAYPEELKKPVLKFLGETGKYLMNQIK